MYVWQRRRCVSAGATGWNGEPPAGIRAVIHAPTPSICLLQRIYVRDKAEYAELHTLQDAIRLTPLDRWQQGTGGFPMLDLEGAFNIALRTYQPQDGIVMGTWFPPAIVRAD